MIRWLALWLALFAGGLVLYHTTYAATRPFLVDLLQVRPAAWLTDRSLPAVDVQPQASRLRALGTELEIRKGCDGMEVWLMLVTALLACPLPWTRRLRGIVYGSLLVYALNLLRVVTVFHVAVKRPGWFVAMHEFVWPTAIVLTVVAFVMVQFQAPPRGGAAAGAEP